MFDWSTLILTPKPNGDTLWLQIVFIFLLTVFLAGLIGIRHLAYLDFKIKVHTTLILASELDFICKVVNAYLKEKQMSQEMFYEKQYDTLQTIPTLSFTRSIFKTKNGMYNKWFERRETELFRNMIKEFSKGSFNNLLLDSIHFMMDLKIDTKGYEDSITAVCGNLFTEESANEYLAYRTSAQ